MPRRCGDTRSGRPIDPSTHRPIDPNAAQATVWPSRPQIGCTAIVPARVCRRGLPSQTVAAPRGLRASRRPAGASRQVGGGRAMDDALGDSARVWGVQCSDGQVLWVDDEDAANRVLTSLIGAERVVQRTTSDDPPAVLDHLPELNPDLVLLDLYMPYVDGYTMLRHIRDWAGQEYLPVVVLTADVRPETLLRAINDGATDFLTKPFNATEILIRVRNLLHTRSLHLAVKDLAESCGPGERGRPTSASR